MPEAEELQTESAIADNGRAEDNGAPEDRRKAPRFEAKIRINVQEESFKGTIENCSTDGFLARITQTSVGIDDFNQLAGETVNMQIFYMMHKLGDYSAKLVRATQNETGHFLAFQFDWTKPQLINKLVSVVKNR